MAKAQVLLVEDDGVVAIDTKSRLKKLGYAISAIVPSGEEAIEKAKDKTPDLVLMNVRLRDEMDGFEAGREIRSRLRIPIIYMTGYPDDKTWEEAGITEPSEYLVKPVDSIDLEKAIDSALRKAKELSGQQCR